MAFVFVGPLSRCYARRTGEATRLRAGVETWRADLCAGVADKVAAQLVWDEGADLEFRADLGEAGWMGVRLLACYAERADLELPDTVPALLELDTAWREGVAAKFGKSHFGQLLACTAWLPGEFPVTIGAPLPDGETAEIGSIQVLADQLRRLNQRTFQADLDALATWRELPAPAGGDLLDAARRGLAALSAAAATAERFGLPMLLRD